MGAGLGSLKRDRGKVIGDQSAMKIAEGALVELGGIVSRVSGLAMRAASGTLSDVDRGALDAELQGRTEEADPSRDCSGPFAAVTRRCFAKRWHAGWKAKFLESLKS